MDKTETGIRILFLILALVLWQSGGFGYLQSIVIGLADFVVAGDISRLALNRLIELVCLVVIGVMTPWLINRWRRSSSATE